MWAFCVYRNLPTFSPQITHKTMTKEEAKKELENGAKITHRLFSASEYVYIENGRIIDEDGYVMHDFWKYREGKSFDDGWEVIS